MRAGGWAGGKSCVSKKKGGKLEREMAAVVGQNSGATWSERRPRNRVPFTRVIGVYVAFMSPESVALVREDRPLRCWVS